MLVNEFKNYVENYIDKYYSALKMKKGNPFINDDYKKMYLNFLKLHLYVDKKYLTDFYNELGLNYTDIELRLSTIQHVEEKSRINIKSVSKFDKIVQYSMYYFTHNDDKINGYDLMDKINECSYDEQLEIYYNIVSACIDVNKNVNNYYINEFYNKIFETNTRNELCHEQDIANIVLDIGNNKHINADNIMKQKLTNLMEKAGITNYEINQLDYTQVTPDYNSNWCGGDYGSMNYCFTGNLKTEKKDYGWVAVVKDLGWNISTDGKNFYLSKLSGPSTIEFSENEISKYLYNYEDKDNYNDKYKPTLVLTEEKLIEYLSTNIKYNPIEGFIKVRISKFDPYFESGQYSGFGRIYSPDYGEKFENAINRIKVNPTDIEDCESIELIPQSDIFYIKFKFMITKSKQDLINDCEKYVYNLIKNNGDILKHYTKEYYWLDAIHCNHFKLGDPYD